MTELLDKEEETTAYVPTDEDDIRQYLREIRSYPRLTQEEERVLAQRCAEGDEEAIRKMVNCNLRLVVSVAKEYSGRGYKRKKEGNFNVKCYNSIRKRRGN